MPWEMIGHRWAVELLRRHVVEGRVRHAYLFSGPEGVGKRTLARRFAEVLNCETPPSAGERCGRCRACRLIETQSHPDLHIVEKGPEDTQIKIDQVRELQRKLALASFEARRRIALLDGLHEASIEAQNALLKTLEEPAPRVVLLVIARQADDLLPTIVSRCEPVALRPVPTKEIEEALASRGEPRERARLLAALSGGRPGEALHLAADPTQLEERARCLDDLQRLLRAGAVERFAYVGDKVGVKRGLELEGKRRETLDMLVTWLGFLRDGIVVAHGADAGLLNPDRQEDLQRLANGAGGSGTLAAAEAVDRTIEAVRKNANLQLALETLMLDLPRLRVVQAGQ